jgi:CDP-glycerol glycerophosphotransferase
MATPADTVAAREKLGVTPAERVVLYTPTHREWLRPGQQVLDLEAFADRLGPDTVLLVRSHYFHVTATQRTEARRGRIMNVSAYPVVEDLYLAADVMITDYSSAMFDFAVLDRPVVIFAPDAFFLSHAAYAVCWVLRYPVYFFAAAEFGLTFLPGAGLVFS